jgi:hypothetical protein
MAGETEFAVTFQPKHQQPALLSLVTDREQAD